jgi:hypothetical protein
VAESADRRLVALSLPSGAVIVLDSTTGAQLLAVHGDGTPILRQRRHWVSTSGTQCDVSGKSG